MSPLERFWRKTTVSGACIVWTGARKATGYGAFNPDGKTVRVHRWIYEQTIGPILDGIVLRHSCDNAACVSLQHLEPGTQVQNLDEMRSRGRGVMPHEARARKSRL